MIWAVVGVLCCVTAAETAIILSLVRQQDRILRSAYPVYRSEADAEGKPKTRHFSMYQNRQEDNA